LITKKMGDKTPALWTQGRWVLTTPYEPHADIEAAALMFNVAPGTIGYWASLYKISSIPDPGHPRRRLYHLGQLQAAAETQAAKRQARRKTTT
jgi:hypothetical protein